jgi:hypothetical protein
LSDSAESLCKLQQLLSTEKAVQDSGQDISNSPSRVAVATKKATMYASSYETSDLSGWASQ